MAATSYRRGYGWSLPPLGSDSPSNEINNVRIFSAKGTSAPGVLGTAPLPQIGTPIPGTIYVYVRPRLSQDEGLLGGGGGSQFPYQRYRFPGGRDAIESDRGAVPRGPRELSVHITNLAYSFYRRFQRSPSIGMAGALSEGRSMGVPFSDEGLPYFSIP